MKVLVKETEGEGLESFIGQRVVLFCAIYIYSGDLVGVNDKCVKLENPVIVYETGPLMDKKWKDAQQLPSPHYIQTGMIESFGPGK